VTGSGAWPDASALPALAARAQLGERAALEALLGALQQPLLAHVRMILRDDDRAADVLQETLILVARRLHTLTEPRWVRAWAYRIATREAVRAARRSHRDALVSVDELAEVAAPEPDGATIDPELVLELPERLAAVPPAAQSVLRLFYLEALTLPEISAALEIPLGTVKSRLAYGLNTLRASWAATRAH
jgi:RNA polymerase sigma-70 factor (ECF subfamily)